MKKYPLGHLCTDPVLVEWIFNEDYDDSWELRDTTPLATPTCRPCNNYVSIPVYQKNILLTWSSDSEMYVSSTCVMDLASRLASDNLECRQGILVSSEEKVYTFTYD